MTVASLIISKSCIRLPGSVTDEQILDIVREWENASALEDYERAYGMTAHTPYFGWYTTLTRKTIEGYGLPESRTRGAYSK